MHARSLFLSAALLCCALPGSRPLSAATIFDNTSLAAGEDYYRQAYAYESGTIWGQTAQRFVTGDGFSTLTAVTLEMQCITAGDLVVELRTSYKNLPGDLFAVLSIMDTPTSEFGLVQFNGWNAPLAANTAYWIVMRANSGSYNWETTANPAAGTGLTRTDYHTKWFSGYIDTLGNQVMKVDAYFPEAVPEPATLLLALPLFALCLRRRA